MKSIFLIYILFLVPRLAIGQSNTIAQFAIWKPKEWQAQNFENGYKQHLSWHKANDDKWSWYGWYFVSGSRYGQFVDATFDHDWADFDNAVRPTDDMADNRIHVFPFGSVQSVFKVSFLPTLSTNDTFSNKLKIVRLVTIDTQNMTLAIELIGKLKQHYVSTKIKSFRTYKMVDGGFTNQLIIMMGFSNWEEYSISEKFTEKVEEIEKSLATKAITSVSSETLVYRSDMSLFPN
jgi:hypothetical protein